MAKPGRTAWRLAQFLRLVTQSGALYFPDHRREFRASNPQRIHRWKKLWGTPKRLNDEENAAAFDEFADALGTQPHAQQKFLKTFGVPKAPFGNRFFLDDAVYKNWDIRLATLLPPDATYMLRWSCLRFAGCAGGPSAKGRDANIVVDDGTRPARLSVSGRASVVLLSPKCGGASLGAD